MKKRLQFEAMIFIPEGAQGQLQLQELALPQEQSQALFKEFRDAVKRGTGFQYTLGVGPDDKQPTTISFSHIGKTAALVILSMNDDKGQPYYMHGIVALLSKLDAKEDAEAMDHVRKYKCLSKIQPGSFDIPQRADHPVAAIYFAELQSANYPPLHSYLKILTAVFFDQFGIISDDGN